MLIVNENTKHLPDAFCKYAESNNNKMLTLYSELKAKANNDMLEIFESLDLYQAIGYTLDLFGDFVGQKRGSLTDDQYRILILVKIARNVANTDFNAIINVLSLILNCEKSAISLENGENPATIKILNLPLKVLIAVGFTASQAIDILNLLLPVTVTLDGANFDGTFEFGSIDADNYAPDKGFGNIEQSTGGYFGLFIEGSGGKLPV